MLEIMKNKYLIIIVKYLGKKKNLQFNQLMNESKTHNYKTIQKKNVKSK